ncbi:MAG: class I SAM-dependent methyltransferase [Candidatus Levyibacteriota bacterium]|nr:MAG: class I SAM-dependent methyltransferase [Candidatus Levybacteria bacterium]
MKIIKRTSFDEFYLANEDVAKTSPMRTHYDSPNPLERTLWTNKKKIIKKILAPLPITNILDAGCGDGRLIDEIDKQVAYTGIDISPTQITEAKKYIKKIKRKNVTLIKGDVTKMPFKANAFDAALACDIVEHVLSPQTLFKELKRVVKKNGYIIFGIPNEDLWEFARLLQLKFPLHSPDHIHAIYPSDIEQVFPVIEKKISLPIPFSSRLSLINVFLVKNV